MHLPGLPSLSKSPFSIFLIVASMHSSSRRDETIAVGSALRSGSLKPGQGEIPLELLQEKLDWLQRKKTLMDEYYASTRGHTYVRAPQTEKIAQAIADVEAEISSREQPESNRHLLFRKKHSFRLGGTSDAIAKATSTDRKSVV